MTTFRYALRALVRKPLFSATAILCAGLGTGATTAIFSVVNAVILRPLPYAQSDRLVRIFSEFPKEVSATSAGGFHHFWISPPEFLDLKRDTQSWDRIEAWVNSTGNIAGLAEPVRATVSYVTGGLMDMLAVRPMLGRLLTPADDRPNAPTTAILSYDLWQRAYGGDPKILNHDIHLDGSACTVVGIMPRGFNFPPGEVNPAELWSPLGLDPTHPGSRGSHYLSVLGRLRAGVSMAQAQTEMTRYAIHSLQTTPMNQHRFDPVEHPLVLAGFQDEVVHNVRPAMLVLLGAVGFVLLIACVNVANLLLARSEVRGKEIAIRTAIGANARQLLGQFLMEGLLLSGAGAAVGLVFAGGGLRLLAATGAASIPRAGEIAIDWRVLLFSLAVALATGLIFGLAPMMHTRPAMLHETLKSAVGRLTGSASANRFRSALVASELAFALILLIGSGLMVKAFWRLQEVNAGITADHLLTMQLSLPPATYKTKAQANGFWSSLLDRENALPGVESAAISTGLPPNRSVNANTTPIENLPAEVGGPAPTIDYWNSVDPTYFRTAGIRLIEGRLLNRGDGADAPPVAVINEAMARTFWRNESPLGHRLKTDFHKESQWRTIVGVVADVKNGGLDKPTGTELYFPYQQETTAPSVTNQFVASAYLVIRTKVDPDAVADPARLQIRAMDPTIPISQLSTMEDVLSRSVSRPRFLTLLMALFSALSLVLAALGIYGVISYAVAQRTAEIGIRMALGAENRHILALVGKSGMRMAAGGILAGGIGALALTRYLSGLLFGVSSLDVPTFLAMAAVLAAVALLACYIPARRASRISPTVALRYE